MATKRIPFIKAASEEVQAQAARAAVAKIEPPFKSNEPLPQTDTVESTDDSAETSYWQKITISFRHEQVKALHDIIRTWENEADISVAMVELIRLATDDMIALAQQQREVVWRRIKAQAEREYRENPKSKHSKSKSINIRLK